MGKKINKQYWTLSGFFFCYFFTWSAATSLFSIWLGQEIGLTGGQTGIIFSLNAVFALCLQPVYGIVSDKLGMKKNLLWGIVALLVFVGPFFIYVYGPLLKFNLLLGAIIGGMYIGTVFAAGVGAIETYIEKAGRKCNFEYGRSRMWGSLGWAAATFFAGRLFNINPNINFWIASGTAVCLIFLLSFTKIENDTDTEDMEKQNPVTFKDIGLLLKSTKFWFFILYVVGVTCFYSVYDQQFPLYYASLFSTEALGNQVYGYLNSLQVFLEAGMMFVAPFIVNKIGGKKGLILAGFIMAFRVVGSGMVDGAIGISFMKLLHALELPIMLIAIFKYLAANFDNRLSSTLYLVGFQFASQVGAAVIAPIAGRMYDSIGFSQAYMILGGIVFVSTCLSIFTLSNETNEQTEPSEALQTA
ncbi:MAG: MFS transporter [Bacillaceae bacterium]